MRAPAVVVFGLAGCWSASHSAPVAPGPTNLDAAPHDPTGRYWCSIDDEQHLEHQCEIVRDGKLKLTKLNGAERIRGELTLEGDNLVFVGERWCMWTECKEKLRGTFVPGEHGTYRGTFEEAPLVVRLAPMPADTPPPTDETVDRGAPVGQ